MSFISQILEEREFNQEMEAFGNELREMETQLTELKKQAEKLDEADDPMAFAQGNQNIGDLFDEAQRRMSVAKKAFGLTNKLKDPEDRRKHRRNFMIVMNKLRALINRIIKQLTVETDSDSRGNPVSHNGSRMSGMRRPETMGSLRR